MSTGPEEVVRAGAPGDGWIAGQVVAPEAARLDDDPEAAAR